MKKIIGKKYSIISVISKYSFVFIIAFALVMPFMFVSADPNCGGKDQKPCGVQIDGITNPIQGIDNLPQFIEWFINLVLIVGVPLLVLAIIYAGFLYVKAQGNSEELTVAHKTLLYTVIGGALLLGAFVIANAIGKTVEDIKSTT
ncbi:TPA: hypothetical protein DEP30_02435 [Candidatus Nomurabacteria bacterium]|nr:MAG: hypothetical protein UR97_C0003G0005 [Candidatus Nomurabacteria bacterium GW2011_GWE2_36_115]KKP94127.1 MAG: hypothetical protein US00_C0003G0051 [Candidatus Nomurabacteria bacterium GW2011_GWF2_36_126]KKP96745.1 MAG: hypothetical protein US04_C0001G0247 [Candidatus Nomurabacteria bacterium GW2011_GWD2_36_14]KKP99651.1 MAG: hypothetical protein US08_C0001G0334 [Candidatus Nomurabacteria bacterium GW2011_GWF2_36_19]KKQ05433.1 MAG: hypothetical protein US17_C0004G0005 [Candidatus Nomuraba